MKKGLVVRNQKERARLATSGCEKRTEKRKVLEFGFLDNEREKREERVGLSGLVLFLFSRV